MNTTKQQIESHKIMFRNIFSRSKRARKRQAGNVVSKQTNTNTQNKTKSGRRGGSEEGVAGWAGSELAERAATEPALTQHAPGGVTTLQSNDTRPRAETCFAQRANCLTAVDSAEGGCSEVVGV